MTEIRSRRPRWRSRRLRGRALRRVGRPATSPWSRSTGSAAPACTAAASRPRSCCRPPRCCAPSNGAAEFGVQTSAPDARPADDPGPQAAGRRPARRAGSSRCSRAARSRSSPAPARSRADGRTVRVSDGTELRGRNVLIATGSLPRALPVPGFEFDGTRVLSSDHVLELDRRARRASRSSAAARSAASSRRSSSTSAPRSRSSRRCRRSSPASTSRSRRRVVRAFTKRGIKVQTGVAGRRPRPRRRPS